MNDEKELIIVTGCAGRIGSRLCRHFAEQYRVIGLDAVHPRDKSFLTEFFEIDLGNDQSVEKVFAQIKESYGDKLASVIHLAAYYSFSDENFAPYEQITIEGTRRIVKQLYTFQCEQFFFSSTMLVHQPCEVGHPIDENAPVVPKWNYPLSKVKTEKLLHDERHNMPIVIFRIAGCYDEWCHSIPISQQIQRIYEHQFASRVFPGDITHGAAFIHFDDLVDAVSLAVMRRHELPEELVLLISEDQTLNYDQMQRKISHHLFDKEITTQMVPKWFAKMGAWMQDHLPFISDSFVKPWMIDLADDHYELEITRAKQILGWNPKYRLEQVLPAMLDHLKNDPEAWYRENGMKFPQKIEKREKTHV